MLAEPLCRHTGCKLADAPSAVVEAAPCAKWAKSAAWRGLWTTATSSISRALHCRQVGALPLTAQQQDTPREIPQSATSHLVAKCGSKVPDHQQGVMICSSCMPISSQEVDDHTLLANGPTSIDTQHALPGAAMASNTLVATWCLASAENGP